ncbi:MAG TPA: radical SAM protein [Elusimicrobiota bacterium]|jgi:MoaA/NifB/PqqE/SkfB family radical SAM enzyme|nr:radical SAM protein [Elusimicrobiota bacterium]
MELPAFVQIEPVGQCNLRCAMCPIQYRRDGPPWGPPALMPYEAFVRLVEQFPGTRELHLQGLGEPMMHPRLPEMIAYAASRGWTVSVNSNCTLLNRRKALRLAASGLDTIHVSIDGATRGAYESIRAGATFYGVLRGVRLLAWAKRKLSRELPRLRLVFVVMRRNLEELGSLPALARRLEIPSIFVQHLAHDFGEESLPSHYAPMREYVERESLLGEEPRRIEECFARARAAARQEGVELRLPRVSEDAYPEGTPGRERCDWPWRGAYVSYQGLAMPCCMVATPDRAQLGDMARDGVEAVWNGVEYERFRSALEKGPAPGVCRSCSLYRGRF